MTGRKRDAPAVFKLEQRPLFFKTSPMQGPRLFPVVEITTRPFKGNKRQSSVPSHEFPRKKKRLEVDTKFHLTDKAKTLQIIPRSHL